MAATARGEALAGTKIKPRAGTACQTQEREERAELEPVQTDFIEEERWGKEGVGKLKTVKRRVYSFRYFVQ